MGEPEETAGRLLVVRNDLWFLAIGIWLLSGYWLVGISSMDDNIWEYPFGDLEEDDDLFCRGLSPDSEERTGMSQRLASPTSA